MNDTWSEEPFVSGVVLVGDAAGRSDPLIGQGLSIAMRDVRIVSDILLDSSDWSPSAFAPYAKERTERMKRLRVASRLVCDLRCTFTPEAAARRMQFMATMFEDPMKAGPMLAPLIGPDAIPAEAFEDANIERILGN
jgi:2-polyprenyl-6-methoxyphenol hydroxylase-like FAD-dependent oxidoreductase